MSEVVEGTVKDLLEKRKAVELTTPLGLIFIPQQKVAEIAETGTCEGIHILPLAPVEIGPQIAVDFEKLLGFKLLLGGYNESTEAYEYLVG